MPWQGRFIIHHGGREEVLDAASLGTLAGKAARGIADALPEAERIGLVARTSPALIAAWAGCLLAGKTPCILQYPNFKASRDYWGRSVNAGISQCGLEAVLLSEEVDAGLVESAVPTVRLDALETGRGLPSGDAGRLFSGDLAGSIIQLSSGTTGWRKGIEFSLDSLRRHALDYGGHLGLEAEDVMVSWLPLYHDMGFVTSLVMPLLLGFTSVLVDPADWVLRPGLLFEMIERHKGTLTYMPNFGFEVARMHYGEEDLSSMRRFVSCSEPTRAETMERFSAALGVQPGRLSNCYAMAENVFAVAQSDGLDFRQVDGRSWLSCGEPIPGVEVESREGQLWVRSPYSVTSYVSGGKICDARGFYPTGDLGEIVDGVVVVRGRVKDVAIVAGEKYILSDIDHELNEVFPECRGRACALALEDQGKGTQSLLAVVESSRFWDMRPSPGEERALAKATGLELLSVRFVPPSFITKTSSGKVNRRETAGNLRLIGQDQQEEGSGLGRENLLAEFPTLATGLPASEALDSLGFISLSCRLLELGLELAPWHTLDHITRESQASTPKAGVVSIVSLMCGNEDCFIDYDYLDDLSQSLGLPVHFEHFSHPRLDVLLQDLIFHDYFMPRDEENAAHYRQFSQHIKRLKQATVLLIGSYDAFSLPLFNVHSGLDHRFIEDPRAGYLCTRWPGYFAGHGMLKRKIYMPQSYKKNEVNNYIMSLASYVGSLYFRCSFQDEFKAYTKDWEYQEYYGPDDFFPKWYHNPARDFTAVRSVLKKFLVDRKNEFRLTAGEERNKILDPGMWHYCGVLADENLVNECIDFCEPYDRIGIVGPRCSLTSLTNRLLENGKQLVFVAEGDAQAASCDCFVQTGYGEELARDKPCFLVMDHPLSRLERYARLEELVPLSQVREFIQSNTRCADRAKGEELLRANCRRNIPAWGDAVLVAGRDISSDTIIEESMLSVEPGVAGMPGYCARALAGLRLLKPRGKGEVISLLDLEPQRVA
jgi:acyl-CoA synthetase (AMP-forming)/AMP-acid ligase II